MFFFKKEVKLCNQSVVKNIMLHAATESLGRIIQLTKRKRLWLHWRGDDKMDMSYILRLKRLWLCTVKVKHSLRKKKMAELTLKINIRRLVGEKQNNLLRHSNHICQWNQVKSQKRLDLVKDLGPLWKCNLVVKSILFLREWVTFIHRFQSDPWLIIQNYLPPTPQCAEWETERGKRERAPFTHMLIWTSLCLLHVNLRVDQSICWTDDAIRTPRLVQGSLSTHSAKGT